MLGQPDFAIDDDKGTSSKDKPNPNPNLLQESVLIRGKESLKDSGQPGPLGKAGTEQTYRELEAEIEERNSNKPLAKIASDGKVAKFQNYKGQLADDQIFSGINTLTNPGKLNTLTIQNSDVSDSALSRNLSGMTNLTTLTLCETPNTSNIFATIKGLKNLQNLDLQDSKNITDKGFEHLKNLKALEIFSAIGTSIDGTGLHNLSADSMRVLHLSRAKNISTPACKAISTLRNLESLYLFNTGINNDSLTALQPLSKLQRLDIAETKITDEGMKAIAALPSLHSLNMSDTAITSVGVQELAKSKTIDKLELIDCKNIKIDQPLLDALKRMHQLKSLELRGAPLTHEDIKKLTDALPGVRISAGPSLTAPNSAPK